jgi:asparagine synthase (glutamine-hydrolysing)
MCGFVGFLANDPSQLFEQERLAAMARTLERRGPDDQVLIIRPGAALAFRRLSIVDLRGGRQPFELEGGRLIACVNGELYNWREVRARLEAEGVLFHSQSDCEIVPHLYRRHGARLGAELVGMFAGAVIDLAGPRGRLLLLRDRLGIKPLYYARVKGGLLFGSEPKALLASGMLARELRPEALLEYLMQGYVGGPEAAWAGMGRLAPGHALEFEAGGEPRQVAFWSAPREAGRAAPPAEELLEWLDRVVQIRMLADVPLGAFLSGGLDSNAVVDSMSRQSKDPVVACSVGFRERSHDELDEARRTAQRLGLRHHTEVLEPDPAGSLDELAWLYDEPHADPSNLPTLLVSRMARRHVTVALSGDGGDEVFAGYRRYLHDAAEHRLRRAGGAPLVGLAGVLGAVYPKLDWAPRRLRAKTFLQNLARDPARAYYHSVTQASRETALGLLDRDLVARLAGHDPFERFNGFYSAPPAGDPLFRAQYADLHTYLPDQILCKVDRASMGVSLEVRVPLLDHRFIERFATLRPEYKLHAGRGKHYFREGLRGRLPSSVLDGQKRGFDMPLASWLRGSLQSALTEGLAELPRELFAKSALERLRQEHHTGRRDHSRLLWSLLMLSRWWRVHGVRGLVA